MSPQPPPSHLPPLLVALIVGVTIAGCETPENNNPKTHETHAATDTNTPSVNAPDTAPLNPPNIRKDANRQDTTGTLFLLRLQPKAHPDTVAGQLGVTVDAYTRNNPGFFAYLTDKTRRQALQHPEIRSLNRAFETDDPKPEPISVSTTDSTIPPPHIGTFYIRLANNVHPKHIIRRHHLSPDDTSRGQPPAIIAPLTQHQHDRLQQDTLVTSLSRRIHGPTENARPEPIGVTPSGSTTAADSSKR